MMARLLLDVLPSFRVLLGPNGGNDFIGGWGSDKIEGTVRAISSIFTLMQVSC